MRAAGSPLAPAWPPIEIAQHDRREGGVDAGAGGHREQQIDRAVVARRQIVDGAAEPIGLREGDAELAGAIGAASPASTRAMAARAADSAASRSSRRSLARRDEHVLHQDEADEEERDGQPLEQLASDGAVHPIVAEGDQRHAGRIAALGGDDAERVGQPAIERRASS